VHGLFHFSFHQDSFCNAIVSGFCSLLLKSRRACSRKKAKRGVGTMCLIFVEASSSLFPLQTCPGLQTRSKQSPENSGITPFSSVLNSQKIRHAAAPKRLCSLLMRSLHHSFEPKTTHNHSLLLHRFC